MCGGASTGEVIVLVFCYMEYIRVYLFSLLVVKFQLDKPEDVCLSISLYLFEVTHL